MRKTALLAILVSLGSVSAWGGDANLKAEVWAASARNILGSVEIKAVDESLLTVRDAFDAAAEEMGFVPTSSRVKDIEAVLVYRGPGDMKITVKLKEFSSFTNIKLRFGITGDEALSRRMLELVHARL